MVHMELPRWGGEHGPTGTCSEDKRASFRQQDVEWQATKSGQGWVASEGCWQGMAAPVLAAMSGSAELEL